MESKILNGMIKLLSLLLLIFITFSFPTFQGQGQQREEERGQDERDAPLVLGDRVPAPHRVEDQQNGLYHLRELFNGLKPK